jgi:protein ImuB
MNVRALPLPLPTPAPIDAPALRPVPPAPAPTRPGTRKGRAVWLAIHLRGWQLHAALAGLSDQERALLNSKPLAIVEGDRRATLAACNSLAHARGMRPGHSLNASIALCAETQFLSRNLESEASLLEIIATHCERYTSMVSIEPPNELLLEVRGSIKLFGGINALIKEVDADLCGLGLTPQTAMAPTAQSALWLSRVATKPIVVKPLDLIATIGRLPVSYLCWPADIELRLARFGVLTVGDLLRLPRAGLSRRIGHERLEELDCATGRHRQVRRGYRSAESYRDRVLLDFEIETTGVLSTIIEKRFARLNRYLAKRTLATDRVHIELNHRGRDTTPVVIGLAWATSDTSHLTKLMHEHLEKVTLPAPVTEILVRVDRLLPQSSSSQELFGRQLLDNVTTSSEAQARLLEQLCSRFGADIVQQIAVQPDYRPEHANALEPAAIPTAARPPEIPGSLAPRPLWLLSVPKALHNERGHRVVSGPEAIEAGWWDGSPVLRQYFHVKSARGALAWVFRDGQEPHARFVHGLFG